MRVRLAPIVKELPVGFEFLRAEAMSEGYRFLDRLAGDWEAGAMRFRTEGKALLAAYVGRGLAGRGLGGIGGLTRDPFVPGCLRMRRFYVREIFRRSGVARKLATALLVRPGRIGRPVTVNAAFGIEAFWEALGFVADPRDGHSHILAAS